MIRRNAERMTSPEQLKTLKEKKKLKKCFHISTVYRNEFHGINDFCFSAY